MRRYLLWILVAELAIGASAATHRRLTPPPMSKRERARYHARKTVGKRALAGSAASAGVRQLRHRPPEWGGGPTGFVKRFGSSVGQHAVKNGIQFGVGALRHEDPRYYPSHRKGFWPRTRYAVGSTFVTRRSGRPGRTLAAGSLAGNIGSGVVSRLWEPHKGGMIAAGVTTGGIAIGAEAGANMAREFLPDLRHKRRPQRK
jgi:hypothetical protein